MSNSYNNLIEEIIKLLGQDIPFTDIHITEGFPIQIKSPGGWRPVSDQMIVSRTSLEPLLEQLDPDWESTALVGGIDRRLTLISGRLRCNIFSTAGAERLSVSIRRLPLKPPNLSQLGIPAQVSLGLDVSKGLILITGPTGSGKTTSNAALLDYFNQHRAVHIVTVEDPIEYLIEPKRAIISQKEVGSDVSGFTMGLQDALRQKPDIIMIGEVRNRETADAMLHAAESGHLVLATMHSNSAEGAISKLLSFFPADESTHRLHMLAESLIMVIGQSLLSNIAEDKFLLATELLTNNPQIARTIAEGRFERIAEQMHRSEDRSSWLLNDTLLDLYKNGVISRDAARQSSYAWHELKVALDANIGLQRY